MKNRQFLMTSVLFICLALSAAFFHFGRIFLIKEVVCTIDETTPCPDYLQAELNKNKGKSLFQQDFVQQLELISTYQPSLYQYTFHQQLPDSLRVRFISAKQIYAIRTISVGKVFIVDETGVIIDLVDQSQLPTIELPPQIYQGLTLGSRLDSNFHIAFFSMLTQIQAKQIQIAKISLINSEEITLVLNDGKTAQLSVKNAAAEVNKLAYFLENTNSKSINQPIKIIDLRFKYPVIKT